MGFKTLVIQQRSSEVWEKLETVKTEFAKYAGVLSKVKKKLQEATNTVDDAERRTRVLQGKLRQAPHDGSVQLTGLLEFETADEGEEVSGLAMAAGMEETDE